VVYDLWSTRKVHRATLWAGAFLVLVSQVGLPIGKTAAWHAFASWVQELARQAPAPCSIASQLHVPFK
jgi:hypothetical protein